MGLLRIQDYTVGRGGTNCYFLINTGTKELIIVDPGDEASFLESKIGEGGLRPAAILLTHGHFDHILAVEELKRLYDIPVYAGHEEKEILEDGTKNLSSSMGRPCTIIADHYVTQGQSLELAGFSVRVIQTPGHTKGGCCYYIESEQALISGDTLFYESVGRSDFYSGSSSELLTSIRDRLMVLPDEVKVYPGHMNMTTIGHERAFNPYVV